MSMDKQTKGRLRTIVLISVLGVSIVLGIVAIYSYKGDGVSQGKEPPALITSTLMAITPAPTIPATVSYAVAAPSPSLPVVVAAAPTLPVEATSDIATITASDPTAARGAVTEAAGQPTRTMQPVVAAQSTISLVTGSALTPPATGAANNLLASNTPPQVIVLAQGPEGSWQVDSGTASYQLPEGALEGDALGSVAAWPSTSDVPAKVSIELTSRWGEPAGLAFGTQERFTLVRLAPAGSDQMLVRLDSWHDDNLYPGAESYTLARTYAGSSHRLTLDLSGNSLNVDGNVVPLTLATLDPSHCFLYASGEGISFTNLEVTTR